MAWSAQTFLTGFGVWLSEITNSENDYLFASHYSQLVTLNPGESAHLQIQVDFGATGSEMYYRVIGTTDVIAGYEDTISYAAGAIGYVAGSTQRRSIIVSGVSAFRVEVRKGGVTAGTYLPNVIMRKNGINV